MRVDEKLIIGTANFHTEYGIFRDNKLNLSEIELIFKIIKTKKVKFIDTSIAYENCDKILGKYDLSKINIISKIGYYKNINNENLLIDKIIQSIKNLDIKNLYCLLLHSPVISIQHPKNIYKKMLNNLKKDNLVKKIGISVYSPDELNFCFNEMDFNVVQLPLNIFDNRFIKTGWIDKLKKNNIEVHVRSIFLQGLINLETWPAYFNPWLDKINYFQNEIAKLNITSTIAAISYVKNIKNIDKIVLGVNNPNQINEYLDTNVFENNLKYISDNCEITDKGFYNPSFWKNE
jgi:aryl-alcohol dehydrogenase-like predicted oxidoreductase